MNQSAARTREQFDLGLGHIRKAIGTRLGGVSAELTAQGISHPAWEGRGRPRRAADLSGGNRCAGSHH